MAGMKPLLTRQEGFLLFCVVLAIATTLVIFLNWNANSYYVNAYAPVMKESKGRNHDGKDAPEAPVSNQPASHGIKESDIEKVEGKRFRAF